MNHRQKIEAFYRMTGGPASHRAFSLEALKRLRHKIAVVDIERAKVSRILASVACRPFCSSGYMSIRNSSAWVSASP